MQHRAHHRRRLASKGSRLAATGVAAVAVAAGATGTVFAVGHRSPAAASGRSLATGGSAPASKARTTPTVPPKPLAVASVSPSPGTHGVTATTPITVTFSAPPAAGAPHPTVTPAIPGAWSQNGDTETFTPSGGFVPYTTVTVSVPAGLAPAPGHHAEPLAAAYTSQFQVAPGSTVRLQQLLAELGYLPLTFTPSTAEATSAPLVSSAPVTGNWAWRYATTPASLRSLWALGTYNVMTKGAVMAFEANHSLTTDGVAGPAVWTDLLQAAAARQATTQPYNYLMVSKASPETLQVWSAGRVVVSTLANTGVQGAVTPDGTWPVYERFRTTTMTGTDPNGTHYVDHGIPWVAYFYLGDAVHGYVRASYGFPQSNGCVELPIPVAQTVWGFDPLGTLVTVS